MPLHSLTEYKFTVNLSISLDIIGYLSRPSKLAPLLKGLQSLKKSTCPHDDCRRAQLNLARDHQPGVWLIE